MDAQSTAQLTSKKCSACEGGTPKYSLTEAKQQLAELDGWQLAGDGTRIRKSWQAKDFMAAIEFFGEVAKLAEAEDHHPDLHLESYRKVTIELYTHAIGGLSENDFILAAKIDRLPIRLKK